MQVRLLVVTVSIALFAGCAQTSLQESSAENKIAAGGVGVGKYTPYPKIVDYTYVKPHATPPIDRSRNAIVIDARPTKQRYDPGHLPGAINLVEALFDKHKDRLPTDRTKEIIFYCQGPSCELSHSAAYKAEKLGYTNLKVFRGGVPDWEANGGILSVSTDYIKKLLDEKADVVLIDARPERTAEKGMIPGAINMPDNKFDASKLPADKSKPLIFYCGGLTCDLSYKSALKAKQAGYQNVRIYTEGYPAWAAAHPATTPAAAIEQAMHSALAAMTTAVGAATKFMVETTKDKEVISTSFFERIVREDPTKLTIIDVRKLEQCMAGTWPGAQCIPLSELAGKIASLPRDKPIVFTCGTGAQASMAHDLFTEQKIPGEAYILDAEVEVVDGKARIKK